jgi:hypothetical protein
VVTRHTGPETGPETEPETRPEAPPSIADLKPLTDRPQ